MATPDGTGGSSSGKRGRETNSGEVRGNAMGGPLLLGIPAAAAGAAGRSRAGTCTTRVSGARSSVQGSRPPEKPRQAPVGAGWRDRGPPAGASAPTGGGWSRPAVPGGDSGETAVGASTPGTTGATEAVVKDAAAVGGKGGGSKVGPAARSSTSWRREATSVSGQLGPPAAAERV